jgi:hypothetical protein
MLMLLAEKWTPVLQESRICEEGRLVRTLADENQVWVPRSLRFVQAAGACPM